MEKVLTAQMLWENFDPTAEKLDTNILRVSEQDGIVTKQLYFTGRSFGGDRKTRVFATLCSKSVNSAKPAILLVGDYKKPIEVDKLRAIAEKGFTAMAIDFAGRCDKGLYTLYAEDVDYCNDDVAGDMFEVAHTVRETKMFEYALNCRRAITYLCTETKASSVSLVTVSRGAYVGLIALAVDDRLTNGAVLFGNLYREYPALKNADLLVVDNEDELQRRLSYDEKRQVWITGLAPQTYASQIKVPMYVVLSANSHAVDLWQSQVIFRRMSENSRLLILPTVTDYVNEGQFAGVLKFLKGGEPGEKAEIASFTDENGDYCLKVTAPTSIKKTTVWYTLNATGQAHYWHKATLNKEGTAYVVKPEFQQKQSELWAFVTCEGEISYSTPIFSEQVTANKVRYANNIIFSGVTSRPLIPVCTTRSWLAPDLQPTLAKGYLDIEGAQGKALATFALSDSSMRKKGICTVSFDICCTAKQSLTVTAVCNFGQSNDVYYQQAEILGNGRWQRVTVDGENFRSAKDGRPLAEEEQVQMLVFSAKETFILNNIVLV